MRAGTRAKNEPRQGENKRIRQTWWAGHDKHTDKLNLKMYFIVLNTVVMYACIHSSILFKIMVTVVPVTGSMWHKTGDNLDGMMSHPLKYDGQEHHIVHHVVRCLLKKHLLYAP